MKKSYKMCVIYFYPFLFVMQAVLE